MTTLARDTKNVKVRPRLSAVGAGTNVSIDVQIGFPVGLASSREDLKKAMCSVVERENVGWKV